MASTARPPLDPTMVSLAAARRAAVAAGGRVVPVSPASSGTAGSPPTRSPVSMPLPPTGMWYRSAPPPRGPAAAAHAHAAAHAQAQAQAQAQAHAAAQAAAHAAQAAGGSPPGSKPMRSPLRRPAYYPMHPYYNWHPHMVPRPVPATSPHGSPHSSPHSSPTLVSGMPHHALPGAGLPMMMLPRARAKAELRGRSKELDDATAAHASIPPPHAGGGVLLPAVGGKRSHSGAFGAAELAAVAALQGGAKRTRRPKRAAAAAAEAATHAAAEAGLFARNGSGAYDDQSARGDEPYEVEEDEPEHDDDEHELELGHHAHRARQHHVREPHPSHGHSHRADTDDGDDEEVDVDSDRCPRCGQPKPARSHWRREKSSGKRFCQPCYDKRKRLENLARRDLKCVSCGTNRCADWYGVRKGKPRCHACYRRDMKRGRGSGGASGGRSRR